MKKECIFCNLKKTWIYDNRVFYTVFDIHPASPGHALVIPKKHTVSLLDLTKDEWPYLRDAIHKTINIIEKTDFVKLYKKMHEANPSKRSPWFVQKMLKHKSVRKKPEGYNIGNNEGEIAGRTVHHLHVQIIPRYKGDVKNPTGGIRTVIPELGNYK